MNSNTILQATLLDIIFENRNKEYGAYTLRKFYNNRLCMSVITMMLFAVSFSLFHFFGNSAQSLLKPPVIFEMPGHDFSKFTNEPKAILFPAKPVTKKPAKIDPAETTPKITDEQNINKLNASNETPVASHTTVEGNGKEILGVDMNLGGNLANGSDAPGTPEASEKPKSSKPVILTTPEVMPQFPGGLKALLAYLKRNLKAPDDVEDGKEISVKVRFVVNYNGQLESFKVVQSGGSIFDNEVLRVLQKMPDWIPGKSNSENVSVYYTIPVKFTSDL